MRKVGVYDTTVTPDAGYYTYAVERDGMTIIYNQDGNIVYQYPTTPTTEQTVYSEPSPQSPVSNADVIAPATATTTTTNDTAQAETESGGNSGLLLLAGVAALYFLMKKKKRK